MALVIEVVEGQSVYVGDTRVRLEKVSSPTRFKIMVDGIMPRVFEIDDKQTYEILPNVKLQAGSVRHPKDRTVKFALDAPPSIKILREKLYFETKK